MSVSASQTHKEYETEKGYRYGKREEQKDDIDPFNCIDGDEEEHLRRVGQVSLGYENLNSRFDG